MANSHVLLPRLLRCSAQLTPRPFQPSGPVINRVLSRSFGHSVRLIALEDLPQQGYYRGDVVSVKAGFARNFLVPKKKAVYATPQNFQKLGIVDPDFESEEDRIERLQKES